MTRTNVTCIVALLLFVGPAVARAADDAHDQAARELLRVMRVEEVAKAGAATMADVMTQTNPALMAYRDVIAEWTKKVMTWDAMAPGMVEAYKSAFTTEEMRKIAAFYGTPEGQKLLAKMPELMQKQAKIGTALAQQHQGELREMISARAKELEKKTPGAGTKAP